jgi:predicted Fe-S protein YdhL (DUF1289 family)
MVRLRWAGEGVEQDRVEQFWGEGEERGRVRVCHGEWRRMCEGCSRKRSERKEEKEEKRAKGEVDFLSFSLQGSLKELSTRKTTARPTRRYTQVEPTIPRFFLPFPPSTTKTSGSRPLCSPPLLGTSSAPSSPRPERKAEAIVQQNKRRRL